MALLGRYCSAAYYSAICRIFGIQQNIRFRQIANIWVSVVLYFDANFQRLNISVPILFNDNIKIRNSTHAQMYVPNSVSSFGSTENLIAMRASLAGSMKYQMKVQRAYLDIRKTRMKYIDKPSERCTNHDNAPNLTACIAEYIHNKIGCSTNIQGVIPTNMPVCNLTNQFREYIGMVKKVDHRLRNSRSASRFGA